MANLDLRVLLVDDDQDDYLLAREMLLESGNQHYKLDWVSTYHEGRQLLLKGQHDVYLIDYRLGEHDGLQLLQEAVARGCQSPIIMLTGIGEREIDLIAMKAGAADYLVKGEVNATVLDRSIRYALERAGLLKTLSELATHDDLTGLYNRREMNRLLGEEVDRYKRHQDPLTLILLDIDDFKKVNDLYGHPVGDEVLRSVARQLQVSVRNIDRVARCGGDEFAVILPETGGKVALEVAQRLWQAITNCPCEIQNPDMEIFHITVKVSLGVAECPANAQTSEALFRAADRALYQGKRTGKNRAIRFHNGL